MLTGSRPYVQTAYFSLSCCKICNNCLGLNLCNHFVNFAPQPFDFGNGFADFVVELFDVDDFAGVFVFDIVADSEVVVVVFDGLLSGVWGDMRHIGLSAVEFSIASTWFFA